MRAQRMGRTDYAIKCFTEALAIQEDFETMGYPAQVLHPDHELDEGAQTTGTHDRNRAGTYLHLPQSCQRMLHAGRLSRHGRSGKEGYRE